VKASNYIRKLDSNFELNDINNEINIKQLDEFMNNEKDEKDEINLNKP